MRKLQISAISLLLLSACQQTGGNTYSQNPNTYKGAGIGAALGGVIGAATGGNERDRWTRGAIGAGVGAALGGGIGQYMDRQEADIQRQMAGSGVQVQRQGNDILLNMPSSITFDFNKSSVSPQFFGTLDNLAGVLNQYPDTIIDVVGHTDNVGSDEYNQRLSENRAFAVTSYLSSRGVGTNRLRAIGRGETQPISSNETDSGRLANRRVEVRISPITQ